MERFKYKCTTQRRRHTTVKNGNTSRRRRNVTFPATRWRGPATVTVSEWTSRIARCRGCTWRSCRSGSSLLALGLFTPTKRTILRFHVNRCFVIFEFDLYCFIDNNMQRETMNFLNDIHIVLSEIKKNFRSVCEFN